MREIRLNGYIDDELWWGDEITPELLREALYGAQNEHTGDVHILLNSYGGSCNAAVRMYDDIHAYPGKVTITVSGTAASAATVVAMAADRLEMTPGSLWMIHDPSTIAWGNEYDFTEALNLLKACKESILNIYDRACVQPREELATMMTAATWMDARQALADGFIDGISADLKSGAPDNTLQPHTVNRIDAEAKVQAWLDRHKPHKPRLTRPVREKSPPPDDDHTATGPLQDEPEHSPECQDGTAQTELPDDPGTPIAQLEHRLGLIMPTRRK